MKLSLVMTVVGVVAGAGSVALLPGGPAPARVSGSTLFEGILLDASGAPLAGRDLTLYLWPDEHRLAAMKVGRTFRLRMVARVRSARDGRFALRDVASPSGAGSGLRGIRDVTLVARDANGESTALDTSVQVTPAGLRSLPHLYDDSARGDATVRRPMAGAAPFVTLRMHAHAVARRGTAERKACTVTYGTTSTTLVKKYGNRLTAVGGLYATTNGHVSRFTLSKGSEASLGVAISQGGWHSSGTVSRGLESSTRWGARRKAGGRVLQTRYTVGRYKLVTAIDPYGTCVTSYTMKPIVQEGGAESHRGPIPKATFCRPYEKGSEVILDRNRATTWSNGLDMSSILKFDLSARSGYSESEQVVVDIVVRRRQICGTNRFPAQHPSAVVVKPR